MESSVQQFTDATLINIKGRIDHKTAKDFEEALKSHLGDGQTGSLVLDLGELEYMTSAGLRVLLMLAKKLQGTGGHLVLCAMPESVRLVFELAGFLPIFEIEDTRQAALSRLGAA